MKVKIIPKMNFGTDAAIILTKGVNKTCFYFDQRKEGYMKNLFHFYMDDVELPTIGKVLPKKMEVFIDFNRPFEIRVSGARII